MRSHDNPTEVAAAAEKFEIGSNVIYRSPGGDIVELGQVTDVTARYVFVRFAGDQHSKACDPNTLAQEYSLGKN